MDDCHRPMPIESIQTRKRKADPDDCEVPDRPPSVSQLVPDNSATVPHTNKLLDPPTTSHSVDLSAPPPRLSLETAATAACTESGEYTTGPLTENSPLPSPSVPPCPPSPQADSPSRPKRPRIDFASPTPSSPSSASRTSSRGTSPSSQPTAHLTAKPNWQWTRTPHGTRLTAQIPPQSSRNIPLPKGQPNAVPRIVIPIDPSSAHIPIRAPPINKETLKELDLDAIMRNPQLRHDFLFDSGLQFRAAASRRKREQAEVYWRAVLLELNTGCTCVTFDLSGRPHSCVCVCNRLPLPPQDPVIAYLSIRHRLTLRMPSRVKPLLHELLQVLLSIIRPQTAAPSNGTQSGNTPNPQRLRQLCEQAQQLRGVLDADLINQELKHGLYDPSGTFRVIGEVLKAHCAPMRDQAVDAMVALASKCAPGGGGSNADAVQAMRKCFEILELMKLDIANHQMQTLRNYIIQSSPVFELKTFVERHQQTSTPFLLTRQWLASAHERLMESKYVVPFPMKSLPYATLGKRTCIIVSTLKALVDLVFTPPSPVPLSAPPVTTTVPSHQTVPHILSQLPGYPETLFLDHSRLILLTRDAADLTAIYMFLMLYRQLLYVSPPPSGAKRELTIEESDLRNLKTEIWELGPQNVGRCFLPQEQSRTDREAEHARKESEKWSNGVKSIVLQVTARASEARRGPTPATSISPPGSVSPASASISVSPSPTTTSEDASLGSSPASATPSPQLASAARMLRAPEQHLLKIAESWADTNLCRSSPFTTLMRNRLRDAVFNSVVSMVMKRGNVSLSSPSSPSSSSFSSVNEGNGGAKETFGTATGLEPLASEIRQLVERLAKLAVLHLNVYQTVYEANCAIPSGSPVSS